MLGGGDTIYQMSEAQNNPYQTLGKHLRYLREQSKESVAEVSGAVEIDEQHLERIESGHERPAEDILLLLISHFNMQDQEAVQLWELAGYDSDDTVRTKTEDMIQDSIASGHKPVVVVMGVDARTMYTDSVNIDADQAGVTMQFGQKMGKGQQLPVAKLGMSYEQAERVLHELQMALLRGKYQFGQKQLPPSTDK